MGYGRLNKTDPGGRSDPVTFQLPDDAVSLPATPTPNRRKKRLLILSLFSLILIIAAAISATFLAGTRPHSETRDEPPRKPTQAISKACSRTRYPTLCVKSLVDIPESQHANDQDLVHISFNLTLQHLNRALYSSSEISSVEMDPHLRSAYDACLELLDDSIEALSRSLQLVANRAGSAEDVVTWLSGALTNQDTCTEGLAGVRGAVKDRMMGNLGDLSELVSNCLALFSGDLGGVPIQNKRRLLTSGGFPGWVGRRERRLLGLPVGALAADIVVSKDGNGTVNTIAEAIKKAPENSGRRTIIYVMAGR